MLVMLSRKYKPVMVLRTLNGLNRNSVKSQQVKHYFCKLYLSDRYMLYYWQKFFSALHQIFDVAEKASDGSGVSYLDHLSDMIGKALKVETLLIECVSIFLLSPEVLFVFGE